MIEYFILGFWTWVLWYWLVRDKTERKDWKQIVIPFIWPLAWLLVLGMLISAAIIGDYHDKPRE